MREVQELLRKMPAISESLLLVNIGQLLTLRSDSEEGGPRRGKQLGQLGILQNGAALCAGGKIVSVGTMKEAMADQWLKRHRGHVREVDCRNRVVLPGFVDAHTHPVFAKPRLVDFEERIAGSSYEQIAQKGGGIRASVAGVREAPPQALAGKVLAALQQMAAYGTTTVEAKSGYGLSLESEIKSLEAIAEASVRWAGEIVPTFLGAHVVPEEFRSHPQIYVQLVCEKMMPLVARKRLARFADVFCDRGAFTLEQSRQIFEAAHHHGLQLRAHVCQLSQCALDDLLKFHPASLDHLDHVAETDMAALAATHTIATLVPGANFFLGLESYPPARRLIEAGAAVALATDYNPGTSPTCSMPFVLSLACTHMKLTVAEAISAATINGAWSLRVQKSKGTIEPGKDADLAVFEVEDYREIAYWVGSNPCAMTIIGGEVQAAGRRFE